MWTGLEIYCLREDTHPPNHLAIKDCFFIKGKGKYLRKKYEPLRSRGAGGTQALDGRPLKNTFFYVRLPYLNLSFQFFD